MTSIWHGELEFLLQRFIKVVDAVKIFAAIPWGLAHLPDLDQIEDDLAEVACVLNAPVVQDTLGEVAILLQGILANGLTQFLAGQMPLGLPFRRSIVWWGRWFCRRFFRFFARLASSHAERFLRETECFEDKDVGIELVAPIAVQQFGNGVGWVEHDH